MEIRQMQQLIYAMQFKGQAAPVEGTSGVLRASTRAPSCTMTSLVGPEGLAGVITPAAGGAVEFVSEVTFTGESSFLESGTISFGGSGHQLRFSTVGQGFLGPSPEAGVQHGAVTWRIDDGAGQFAGAHGLITSNFLVGPNGEVTDHHLGVIYLEGT
jgi:hypothetical protein